MRQARSPRSTRPRSFACSCSFFDWDSSRRLEHSRPGLHLQGTLEGGYYTLFSLVRVLSHAMAASEAESKRSPRQATSIRPMARHLTQQMLLYARDLDRTQPRIRTSEQEPSPLLTLPDLEIPGQQAKPFDERTTAIVFADLDTSASAPGEEKGRALASIHTRHPAWTNLHNRSRSSGLDRDRKGRVTFDMLQFARLLATWCARKCPVKLPIVVDWHASI